MDYKTSDTGLAAYLLLLGFTCIGAVAVENDDRRYDFAFIDVDDPHKHAQDYLENKAEGKLNAFRKKLQYLNHILRSEALDHDKLDELRG